MGAKKISFNLFNVAARRFFGLLSFLIFSFAVSSCATSEKTLLLETADGLARLTAVTADNASNGVIVKVYSTRKLEYSSYKLTEPNRVAVEISNSTFDSPLGNKGMGGLVTALNVVRFPKSNSVRIEMAVSADAKVKFEQRNEFLEIVLLPETTAPKEQATGDGGAAKLENAKERKAASALEEENAALKKQLSEAGKQLEDAEKLSKVMQSRVEMAEKQLDELEEKIAEQSKLTSNEPSLDPRVKRKN